MYIADHACDLNLASCAPRQALGVAWRELEINWIEGGPIKLLNPKNEEEM